MAQVNPQILQEAKLNKYVTIITTILTKLTEDGKVTIDFILNLESQVFGRTNNEESNNELVEFLIEEWKDNSFLVYNPEDKAFYNRKTKM